MEYYQYAGSMPRVPIQSLTWKVTVIIYRYPSPLRLP